MKLNELRYENILLIDDYRIIFIDRRELFNRNILGWCIIFICVMMLGVEGVEIFKKFVDINDNDIW